MGLGKKGVFYTIIGILLLVLLSSFGLYSTQDYSELERSSVSNRLVSVNSFLENVQSDSEIAAYASTFRSFIEASKKVENTGEYLNNSDLFIADLVKNGTHKGESFDLMGHNTLEDWADKMIHQADLLGINLEIDFLGTVVEQSDPWYVDVKTNIKLTCVDTKLDSNWNITYTSLAQVPITNLPDPIHTVETKNNKPRIIVQTIYETSNFVTDVNNLKDHLDQGYYIAFPDAPSYMQRLEGDFSNSTYGIESLIDKDILDEFLIVNETSSNIDYIFFNNNINKTYDFNSVSSTFWLDNTSASIEGTPVTHIELYGLN